MLLIKYNTCNLINWLFEEKILFSCQIWLTWKYKANEMTQQTLHFTLHIFPWNSLKNTGTAKTRDKLTLKLIIWKRYRQVKGQKIHTSKSLPFPGERRILDFTLSSGQGASVCVCLWTYTFKFHSRFPFHSLFSFSSSVSAWAHSNICIWASVVVIQL